MCNGKEVLDQLNYLRNSRTVIIGVGNILKGDDGAGPMVCEKLTGKTCAEIIDAGTVPENYIQPIIKKKPQNLIIIDAIDFGAQPGTIKIFKQEEMNLYVISTHTLSPRMFVDMIAQSTQVNAFFIGIQPAQITFGSPLSAPAMKAVDCLTNTLASIFPPPENSQKK